MAAKVLLASPARDQIHTLFALDLMALSRRSGAPWVTSVGTNLPSQRTALLKLAQTHAFSHLLFLDTDMRFPVDALERLLAHKAPMVGANYRKRSGDFGWTAAVGETAVSSVSRTGIESVDFVAMGVCLIDLAVLAALPQPWFGHDYVERIGNSCTEEVRFCRLVREEGFEVAVDHDLSQQVKHLGVSEIGVNHVDY